MEDIPDGNVKVPTLKGVSVDIHKGDFVAIIGASGSGKSTMMKIDLRIANNIYKLKSL